MPGCKKSAPGHYIEYDLSIILLFCSNLKNPKRQMFEQILIGEISLCTRDKLLAGSLLDEIKTHYGDEARYYHNLVHLDNLAYELLAIKDVLTHWQTIVFSIA